MIKATLRRASLLAAAVVMAAAPARAQRPDALLPLLKPQIRETGYSSLYQVVEHLRPAWLTPPPVVVVDGVEAGGAEALGGIDAQRVQSVQYFTPAQATARGLHLVNAGAPAIVVAMVGSPGGEGASAALPGWGVALTVFPYAPLVSGQVNDWQDLATAPGGWSKLQDDGSAPPWAMAALRFDIRRSMHVELLAGRESREHHERYTDIVTPVSMRYRHHMVAVLAGMRTGMVRVGAGPVVTSTTYRFAYGDCDCVGRASRNKTQRGALAEVAAALPGYRFIFPELRAQVRYLAKTTLSLPQMGPTAQAGGTSVVLTAGIGVGSRR